MTVAEVINELDGDVYLIKAPRGALDYGQKLYASPADERAEAVEIIDMLKTVIETELVRLGLPIEATPTSALGRARAFCREK